MKIVSVFILPQCNKFGTFHKNIGKLPNYREIPKIEEPEAETGNIHYYIYPIFCENIFQFIWNWYLQIYRTLKIIGFNFLV